ncbi:hypothetical protein K227x_11610 [Rubripirellula lacrimiformis]|uniref:protein-tyrosine-phosphatase n=1 Tax=Rubripirellula lacrimiformis TaxID=1930273 RepID=A0A517N6L7_9BACT|nr:phosphatase PAP2/dual specificity phosphatase family protein [Rubripirellula lacrimiformis]QDT02783.1 hypothetical protein K227x_11610 [Rubripirellula lacrimiformis]
MMDHPNSVASKSWMLRPCRHRVSFVNALGVSVTGCLLFLVLYGGASYLTSLRTDVGTWRYSWEQYIPLVPIMVVPYMSIDVFFAISPFLCRDQKELRVLAFRLAAVIAGAAFCFVVFPLQLAVERPVASGFFGGIYNAFTALDRPYNLCPSMHIGLRTVLAAHFVRHCRRRSTKAVTHVWFFLIGCSTLLLWQHHVIDVVGGFVLALMVMYAIDGKPWIRQRGGDALANWQGAIWYGSAAMLSVLPVLVWPKIAWLTLWPATACGCIALGYAWIGPAVYRRSKGRISMPAKILLTPVLLGQWLSWRHYAKQAEMMNYVCDGVWIGRQLTDVEARLAAGHGIAAVIDVCNAFDEPASLLAMNRLEVPVMDLTAPSDEQLQACFEFIQRHRDRGVLVHCKAGYSRSAAIVAYWMVRTGRAEVAEDAFAALRQIRPAVVIRPEIRRVLRPTCSPSFVATA